MKRRTLFLAIAAVMVAVLVGGGVTFALFSANSAQGDATFTAGTLVIEGMRDQGDTVPGPMFYTSPAEGETASGAGDGVLPTGFWAPGDEHHRVLQIENTGSLNAWLKSARATLDAGSRPLADKLQVRIVYAGSVVASGTLGQFIDAPVAFAPAISCDVGDLIDLHFYVSLPADAGNEYQNATLNASFSVYGEQKAHNP